MPFENNQYFYAALLATAVLPGGAETVDRILEERGLSARDLGGTFFAKRYQAESDVLRDRDYSDDTDRQKNRIFFKSLYSYLQNGGAPDDPVFDGTTDGAYSPAYTVDGSGRQFIKLGGTGSWNNVPLHRCPEGRPPVTKNFFTPPVEYAVNKSDVNRDLLQGRLQLWLTNDGQIFAPLKAAGDSRPSGYEAVDYPGQKAPYHKFVNLSHEDFEGCDKVRRALEYRVVRVPENESIKWVYNTVAGQVDEREILPEKNLVVVVRQSNLEEGASLSAPSDDDILSATGVVKTNMPGMLDDYTPGDKGDGIGQILATDTPGIVRELSRPYFTMTVDEPMQIGLGLSSQIAEPGDRILTRTDGKGGYDVIKKDWIDKGYIALLPVDDSRAPNSGRNLSP